MVDDSNELTEDTNQQSGGNGKGKASGGSGAMGATKAPITPAFFEKMKSIGASMEQITQILRDWKHLKDSDLTRALADFGRIIAKSSAHVAVNFRNGGFDIIHRLLRLFGGRDFYAKLSPEEQRRMGPR
jgi:hypothetical protein